MRVSPVPDNLNQQREKMHVDQTQQTNSADQSTEPLTYWLPVGQASRFVGLLPDPRWTTLKYGCKLVAVLAAS